MRDECQRAAGLVCFINVDFYTDVIFRGERAEAFGPFCAHDPVRYRVFPAEFVDFVRMFEAVQVEMVQRAVRRFIGLEERESRAWDLQIRRACQGPDQGPGEK